MAPLGQSSQFAIFVMKVKKGQFLSREKILPSVIRMVIDKYEFPIPVALFFQRIQERPKMAPFITERNNYGKEEIVRTALYRISFDSQGQDKKYKKVKQRK